MPYWVPWAAFQIPPPDEALPRRLPPRHLLRVHLAFPASPDDRARAASPRLVGGAHDGDVGVASRHSAHQDPHRRDLEGPAPGALDVPGVGEANRRDAPDPPAHL